MLITQSRNDIHESKVNMVLRASRAISRRFRGWVYVRVGIFKSCSYSPQIMLASGIRLVNSKNISLSNGVALGYMSRVETHIIDGMTPNLTIGENTTFGDYVHIGAAGEVQIGRNVLGGSSILIIDHNHGDIRQYIKNQESSPPRERKIIYTGNIIIEDNVWIGDKAIILGGTTIGHGSIVAARAKVKGIYPPFSLIV